MTRTFVTSKGRSALRVVVTALAVGLTVANSVAIPERVRVELKTEAVLGAHPPQLEPRLYEDKGLEALLPPGRQRRLTLTRLGAPPEVLMDLDGQDPRLVAGATRVLLQFERGPLDASSVRPREGLESPLEFTYRLEVEGVGGEVSWVEFVLVEEAVSAP